MLLKFLSVPFGKIKFLYQICYDLMLYHALCAGLQETLKGLQLSEKPQHDKQSTLYEAE
jgi:hypothetical protein